MDTEGCCLDHLSREPALGSMANWHVQLLYLQIYCDIHTGSCFPWAISSHWLNTGEYQKWAIPAWSGHYLATVRPFWLGDWHPLALADTYPEQHCSPRLSSSNPPASLFLTGFRPELQSEGSLFCFFFLIKLTLSLPPFIFPKHFSQQIIFASIPLGICFFEALN